MDITPIADNRQHFITAYAIDEDDNIGPSAYYICNINRPFRKIHCRRLLLFNIL